MDLDTLRAEVREARLVVADLVDLQTGCSTELWRQRWVIRANVVVDLFLTGLIIRNWLFRVTTQVPVVRADIQWFIIFGGRARGAAVRTSFRWTGFGESESQTHTTIRSEKVRWGIRL